MLVDFGRLFAPDVKMADVILRVAPSRSQDLLRARSRFRRPTSSTWAPTSMTRELLLALELAINAPPPPTCFQLTPSPTCFFATRHRSKKARVPSWTDRILYKPCAEITPREYNSTRTIRTSDHRPVYATFVVGFLRSKEQGDAVAEKVRKQKEDLRQQRQQQQQQPQQTRPQSLSESSPPAQQQQPKSPVAGAGAGTGAASSPTSAQTGAKIGNQNSSSVCVVS